MTQLSAGRTPNAAGRPRTNLESGFTVIELLIAVALMMLVVGAVFTVTSPAQGLFQTQPESADLQQRLRVSVDALTRDLLMAGSVQPATASSAETTFAAVMPHRVGARGGEVGVYRPDVVSVLYVPFTSAQGELAPRDGAERISRGETLLLLRPRPYCAVGEPLCGFASGMHAIIFDDHGAWDLLTIAALQGDALVVQHDGLFSVPYMRGAHVAQVVARTYYLKPDAPRNTSRLNQYDGFASDLPLVDDVVALGFEYFGDAGPPRIVSDAADDVPPETSYGPRPPPLTRDNPDDAWAAGENCVFAAVDGARVPRLDVMGSGVVRLDGAALADGPWCPDAASPHRFDADLLRLRFVRVRMRVQVALSSLRGPAGLLFTRGGTARSAWRYVPDVEVRFDVAPRNLNRTIVGAGS